MKYYVTSTITKKGFVEEDHLTITEDIAEAIKDARRFQTRREPEEVIEIRIYKKDIEDDECDCFDYDIVNYMDKWHLSDEQIDIEMIPYDHDLSEFEFTNSENEILGRITPSDIQNMEMIRKDLTDGINPFDEHWEDGLGNSVSVDGWGDFQAIEITTCNKSHIEVVTGKGFFTIDNDGLAVDEESDRETVISDWINSDIENIEEYIGRKLRKSEIEHLRFELDVYYDRF